MKIITIGLPFYNADRFIRDAIQSVLNQTFTDFRLLIVDDGSTDNSIEIIKSFNDSRIELIQDGCNRGLPYRLNQIANLCNSKYLARMDADDIMHIERIQIQIKTLEMNPEIDVLGTNAYSIDEKNEIKGIRLPCEDEDSLIIVSGFIHPTIIGKSVWFKNNPYDERAIRIEDAELWYRTANKSNFKTINQPLLFYREFGVNYYKKYQKAVSSMFYVANKNIKNNNIKGGVIWSFKGIKFIVKFIVHKMFDIFNQESMLINTRFLKYDYAKIERPIKELNQAIKTK